MRPNLLVVLGLVVAGCRSTTTGAEPELHRTTELALDKVVPSYGAFDDGTKIEIFVAFIGNGFLRLGEGDTVAVDVGGTPVPTTESIDGDKVHYVGALTAPPDEPVVTVTFARGADKVVGKVKIGPSFTVKSPPTHVKVGDVVSLDLDPRPDLTKWPGILGPTLHHVVEVHGDCIDKGSQRFEVCAKDSPQGTCKIVYPFDWDTHALALTDGSTGCKVDVQVRLESPAPTFEGAFHGGFDGAQVRTFQVDVAR